MLPQAENRWVLHKGFPQLAFRPQAIFRQLLYVLDVIGAREARPLFEHCADAVNQPNYHERHHRDLQRLRAHFMT